MRSLVKFSGLKGLSNSTKMINRDTLVFGSFSKNPGNNGTVFFNSKFEENKINAIYKSFYCDNISDSYQAAKSLSFAGFAVSMPFKFDIIHLVDRLENPVDEIGAANTVLFLNGLSIAYNTDWIAARDYLENLNIESLSIAGNGGFSKAIQYACRQLGIKHEVIERNNWNKIYSTENHIFNATPIEIIGDNIIDGRPFTKTGQLIAKSQAERQYKIYSQLFD